MRIAFYSMYERPQPGRNLHPSKYLRIMSGFLAPLKPPIGISRIADIVLYCVSFQSYFSMTDSICVAPPFASRAYICDMDFYLTAEGHRTFYGLLAETGLRVGELCGLTVDDVDLERGLLVVRQSAWRGKLGSTKTKNSVRVIDLSEQCVEQLRSFLQSWRPNEQRLLFATRNGTPWDANMQRKRRFRSLLKKLNIQMPKGNGFHAFRHANAALMDRLSVPMKVRQERLGHSNAAITLGLYTHVVGEDSRAAAGQLGSIVWDRFSGIPAPNGPQLKTA